MGIERGSMQIGTSRGIVQNGIDEGSTQSEMGMGILQLGIEGGRIRLEQEEITFGQE